MPITSSAKKAVSVAKRRASENIVLKNTYKRALKEARKLVLVSPDSATDAISQAQSSLDKAVKTKLLHRRTASRLLSRLASKATSPVVKPTKKAVSAKAKTATKKKKTNKGN
ncbi:MAG: 30S ribosomal protein S20 [Patescibacteria group bacterium]|jgi:small subunit ribosomal protein S20